ncbi:bifunctional nuclease family protein [candidate division KSB1 bacterium]|nr:bifunctional nuclease family protein [candidate division KSB1 bacterium]
MDIAVHVERVTLDTSSNRFVVILRDEKNNRWLPIVVGPAEAQAIALQMEQVTPPRPMTHDLIKNVLEALKVKIAKVVVNDLKDNTYFATIDFKDNGSNQEIDARPSDAIAIALRTDAPIFVDEKVMKKAAISEEMESVEPEMNEEELKTLRVELQRAVKEERYEDAANFRDKINDLLKKLKKKNPSN